MQRDSRSHRSIHLSRSKEELENVEWKLRASLWQYFRYITQICHTFIFLFLFSPLFLQIYTEDSFTGTLLIHIFPPALSFGGIFHCHIMFINVLEKKSFYFIKHLRCIGDEQVKWLYIYVSVVRFQVCVWFVEAGGWMAELGCLCVCLM